MPFFEWEDRFGVGINTIDQQHQRLFALINQLHDAIERCEQLATLEAVLCELDAVTATIGELIDYARYHFSTEEDYMRRYEYPDRLSHQAQHQQFVEEVQGYRKRFEQKKTRISPEVADFLVNWWRTHILNSDKKCGAFCCSKGAT